MPAQTGQKKSADAMEKTAVRSWLAALLRTERQGWTLQQDEWWTKVCRKKLPLSSRIRKNALICLNEFMIPEIPVSAVI